jgi:hypothetical protein
MVPSRIGVTLSVSGRLARNGAAISTSRVLERTVPWLVAFLDE